MGHLSKKVIHKNMIQDDVTRYVYIMNQLTNLGKEEIGIVEESEETNLDASLSVSDSDTNDDVIVEEVQVEENLVYVAGEEESSEDESYE